jgi:hypothetical protein
MNKLYNLCASQEGKDGKTHWSNVGVLFVGEKDGAEKISVKLNSIPTNWNGWLSAFERTDDRTKPTDDVEF